MSWFRKRFGRGVVPDSGAQTVKAVSELMDPYHSRASIEYHKGVLVEPGKVLDNIDLAMERVDIDINTSISIEDDVATTSELMSLVQSLRMGPTLAVRVVNTAMKIMVARYPMEMVRRPLPPEYDLRKITPIDIDDQHHEIAKEIFNQRTVAADDLTEEEIVTKLERLDTAGQLQIFIALFYMFGTKVGAMKYSTGIN